MKQRNAVWRKITIGVFVLALLIFIAHGQLAKSLKPRIDFEEDEWDFGTLIVDETVYHTFKFRNTGDAPLHITKIDGSCACTATLLSSTKLEPQEIGELRVEFKQSTPKNVPRTVKVHSTDPATPVKTLTIRAAVVQPYEVKPVRLFFDTAGIRELEVYSPADLNLELARLETSTGYLSAVIKKSGLVNDKVKFLVQVEFNGSASAHKLDEQITIHTNKDINPIIIPVRVRMSQNIKVHPKKLFFGTVSKGKKVSRSAFVTILDSRYGIEHIECQSQAISANLFQDQDKKYTVMVQLRSDAPLGRFLEPIKIYTNDPNTPLLELTAYGIVVS